MIFFNKKAIQRLCIWFDSQLTFNTHVNEKLKIAKIAKSRITGLSQTYGLSPTLVCRIQIIAE